MPRVTIGIPVFNGSNLISNAINSILAQKYRDYEVIISDNGSTDETLEIARKYCESDPRISLISHNKNIGAVANFEYLRNRGSGELFCWLSHDDYWLPCHLEKLIFCIDEHTSDFASSAPYFFHHQTNRIFSYNDFPEDIFSGSKINNVENYVKLDFWRYAKACIIYGLYRREVMPTLAVAETQKSQKLHSILGSDVIYCAEALAAGRFTYVREKTWFRSERFIPKISNLGPTRLQSFARRKLYQTFAKKYNSLLSEGILDSKLRIYNAYLSAGGDATSATAISREHELQLVDRFFHLKNVRRYFFAE